MLIDKIVNDFVCKTIFVEFWSHLVIYLQAPENNLILHMNSKVDGVEGVERSQP